MGATLSNPVEAVRVQRQKGMIEVAKIEVILRDAGALKSSWILSIFHLRFLHVKTADQSAFP